MRKAVIALGIALALSGRVRTISRSPINKLANEVHHQMQYIARDAKRQDLSLDLLQGTTNNGALPWTQEEVRLSHWLYSVS